ncbi:beta strand repeat-containing protein, partial [Magnetococcales bacterium HHB-1]
SGEDELTFTDTGTITGSYDSGTGVLTLSGTDTVANYEAALRTVGYVNNSENPDTSNRTVSFVVNDGTGDSVAIDSTVSVAAVNDVAVLGGGGNTLNVTENDATAAINSSLTLSDVDNTDISSAVVSIGTGFVSGEDALTFTDTGNITGSYDSGTGVLTLSGVDTVANYEAALRTVGYVNNSENPDTSNRTVSFVVNDGTGDSVAIDSTVSVAAVNDIAVLGGGGNTLNVTENDATAAINSSLTLSDVDNTDISSATVSIGAGFVGSEDALTFTDTGNITGSYNIINGVLTLNGTDTVANYEAALRTVGYVNNSENPDTSNRTVSFVVNDGTGESIAIDSTVTVAAVNDPPSYSSDASIGAVSEDSNWPSGNTINAFLSGTFTDIDGTFAGIAVVGNSANATSEGKWQYSSDNGASWADIAAVADDATALGLSESSKIRFLPAANFNGTPTALVFRAIDDSYSGTWSDSSGETRVTIDTSSNGGSTAIAAVTSNLNASITAVNDAPTFTGNATLAAIDEDLSAPTGETISSLLGSQVQDVDNGSSFSGVAVIGNAANAGTEGIWQYSSDGGSSWDDVGVVADDATALALSSSTELRFIPVADYNGTPPALTVRALDDTYSGSFSDSSTSKVTVDSSTNGADTEISGDTATVSISINSIHDSSQLSQSATLATVSENSASISGETVSSLFSTS